jgi:hypothetical protein
MRRGNNAGQSFIPGLPVHEDTAKNRKWKGKFLNAIRALPQVMAACDFLRTFDVATTETERYSLSGRLR